MMEKIKQLHEALLTEGVEHILPFWVALEDKTNGGFYGGMNHDLLLDKSCEKGGIATARHLWSWSAAYRTFGDQVYLELAHTSYKFLIDHILDKTHGGIFWMVKPDGSVLDDRKHVYAQAFAVYGLAEYVRVTDDNEALEQAKSLFNLIESVGFDQTSGLYKEEFNRLWQEMPNEMLSENGVIADATTNTHLHVLEAYTNLYRVWPDEKVYVALKGLIDLFVHQLYKADTGFIKVFYNKALEEIIDLQSYGHDIEASWLLKEAIDVLALDDEIYQTVITDIAKNIYDNGIAEHGGLITECEEGTNTNNGVWWVQAEAIIGFYNAFEMTGDCKYLDAAYDVWKYTNKYMIDHRTGGEWLAEVDGNNLPKTEAVVEPWKTPYHNIRCCIEIFERTKAYDTSKILFTT